MMHRSVVLNGLPIRPIPKELLNTVVCTDCQQNPARWELGPPSPTAPNYACSFCFLYKIVKSQREQVDWLIREAERARGVIFHRNSDGLLVVEEDADCIAFAVVAGNKIFDAHQRLKAQ